MFLKNIKLLQIQILIQFQYNDLYIININKAHLNSTLMDHLNVALVSDYYYPSIAGVQIHMMNLAEHVSKKVNKLIVITHQYPGYRGIKLVNGIKVYYLKLPYNKNLNVIYLTCTFSHFKIKKILQDQQINLIHVHQSASCLGAELTFHAGILGLKVILTQHSLLSFKRFIDIQLDKILEIISMFYNKVICVSRTTRNNFLLRTDIQWEKLIVIPNAVSIKQTPKNIKIYDPRKPINIIFVGRLTYKRGVDLLMDILIDFFKRVPNVNLKIIGSGEKYHILKKFVQSNNLKDKVQLLGAIQNQKVIQIMKGCHIYINTPLIQSFGIALVQAASQGLLCVSTQVGGIYEVLPKSMLITVSPTKSDFLIGLITAVQHIKTRDHIQHLSQIHQIQAYNWKNISQRVYEVYKKVHIKQKPMTRKQFALKVFKKQKIVGYVILFWFLIISVVNDTYDWWRKKEQRKKMQSFLEQKQKQVQIYKKQIQKKTQ